jgi:antitoxin (DNA-binding transcriptional repressor) of toxin-antitoxin stability system
VARHITQRELRNETPAIMRAIENGESFVLTRNGTPIADLIPHARGTEPRGMLARDWLAAAQKLPPIDADEFFADLDRVVDPDPFRGPGEPDRGYRHPDREPDVPKRSE